jgi:hypothetical protein
MKLDSGELLNLFYIENKFNYNYRVEPYSLGTYKFITTGQYNVGPFAHVYASAIYGK